MSSYPGDEYYATNIVEAEAQILDLEREIATLKAEREAHAAQLHRLTEIWNVLRNTIQGHETWKAQMDAALASVDQGTETQG